MSKLKNTSVFFSALRFSGSGPDPDDSIAEAQTDAEGNFSLSGSTDEISIIDPEVRIHHTCNARGRVIFKLYHIYNYINIYIINNINISNIYIKSYIYILYILFIFNSKSSGLSTKMEDSSSI